MLRGFVCSDGARVELEDCYRECRMATRCLTLPTLRLVGSVREWTGTPSTTQLLNGTRYEFLRLTNDFYIVPESRAFAVLGTMHHGRLEGEGDDLITEQTFEDAKRTGTCDLLELYETTDNWILTDYKSWGSYKVARFLGMTAEYIDDPTGATYQRTTTVGGQKFYAGQPKQVKLWVPNPLIADTHETELQLNHYRLLAMSKGFHIVKMQVQVTVRDGGTITAKGNGIDWRMRCLPVAFLPDDEVEQYFGEKANALHVALASGTCLNPCSQEERWDDRRCQGYCDVAQFCDHGLEVLANADS